MTQHAPPPDPWEAVTVTVGCYDEGNILIPGSQVNVETLRGSMRQIPLPEGYTFPDEARYVRVDFPGLGADMFILPMDLDERAAWIRTHMGDPS